MRSFFNLDLLQGIDDRIDQDDQREDRVSERDCQEADDPLPQCYDRVLS